MFLNDLIWFIMICIWFHCPNVCPKWNQIKRQKKSDKCSSEYLPESACFQNGRKSLYTWTPSSLTWKRMDYLLRGRYCMSLNFYYSLILHWFPCIQLILMPGHYGTHRPPPINVGNLVNLHFQSSMSNSRATKTELGKWDVHTAPTLSPRKVFTKSSQKTTSTPSGPRKLLKRKALLSSPSNYAQKKGLLNIGKLPELGDSLI